MAQEIERKFLVSGEFKSLATSHSRIVQGYISSARGRTVRVRIRDDKGYLTIKGASNASGTSRYEWEKELPLAEAEELMKADVKTPQQFRLQRHLQAIQNEYDYCIRPVTWYEAVSMYSKLTSFMVRMKDLSWRKSNWNRKRNLL